MGQLLLRWFGVFYFAIGIADVFAHDVRGYEFGLLNVNMPHSLIHAVAGLTWILGSFNPQLTKYLAWSGIGLFALLIGLGFAPAVNPLQGWVPLDGNVLWFHVLTLLVLVGVALSSRETAEPVSS